jgi:hypothetical protein
MFWVHIIHALGMLGGAKGYVTCFKDPLHMLPGMLGAPWGGLSNMESLWVQNMTSWWKKTGQRADKGK